MGYRAWRNVKKDLDKAVKKRREAHKEMVDDAKKHGRVSPGLKHCYELAQKEYWQADYEASQYRKFWPGGKIPA
jgi:hypothetical protein